MAGGGRLSDASAADRLPGLRAAVTAHPERLQRLEPELHAPVQICRWAPVVEALQTLRGAPFIWTISIVAELGELTRFDTPPPAHA